jgi:PRTRC genetic system protein E
MKPTDQMNLIPPAGMFTALAPLAKKGQIMLMLSSETDKLRVNLTVKADKAADTLSLALLGTPAELDAELPAALAKARGDAPVLASVADQVAEQIDSKPAAEKKSTPAKPRAAAKKTKIVKPRPAVKKTTVKSAAKPKAKAAARAKFTKDQCLAEYVRLKAIHGDKLTMDVYSKNAKCEGAEIGRSFERMFTVGKNSRRPARNASRRRRRRRPIANLQHPPARQASSRPFNIGDPSVSSGGPPTLVTAKSYDTDGKRHQARRRSSRPQRNADRGRPTPPTAAAEGRGDRQNAHHR